MVKDLGLKTKKPMEVDYVVGDEGRKFVQGIPKKYSSCQAAEPGDETTESETEDDDSDDQVWRDLRRSMRIYFPSRRTVAASKGGIEASTRYVLAYVTTDLFR
ncbi:hypothetical protein ABW20_dc0104276 [Dactylellina cionopaga]|nr:hypothetical protein ABW20_dc0104276 [Dactylellina cionopaga]